MFGKYSTLAQICIFMKYNVQEETQDTKQSTIMIHWKSSVQSYAHFSLRRYQTQTRDSFWEIENTVHTISSDFFSLTLPKVAAMYVLNNHEWLIHKEY